jgi:hypothetical protein
MTDVDATARIADACLELARTLPARA